MAIALNNESDSQDTFTIRNLVSQDSGVLIQNRPSPTGGFIANYTDGK